MDIIIDTKKRPTPEGAGLVSAMHAWISDLRGFRFPEGENFYDIDERAGKFLDAGASHVIVTSYVFLEGVLSEAALAEMIRAVGTKRLVLDLSCRRREDGSYAVVTDRWQKFTDTELNEELAGAEEEDRNVSDDLSAIWKAVEQLPVNQREAIHLFYQEGYKTAEIAEITGRPEATVRSDLKRGRDKLKSILKEADDFE